MRSLLHQLGFSRVEQVHPPEGLSYPLALSLATRNILQKHLKEPIIVLEDDVEFTGVSDIEIAVDGTLIVDAIYLGLFRYSVPQPRSDELILTQPHNPPFLSDSLVQVRGMLAAHAILYLSEKFKQQLISLIDEDNVTAHDRHLATLQFSHTVLANSRPSFFQSAQWNNGYYPKFRLGAFPEYTTRISFVRDYPSSSETTRIRSYQPQVFPPFVNEVPLAEAVGGIAYIIVSPTQNISSTALTGLRSTLETAMRFKRIEWIQAVVDTDGGYLDALSNLFVSRPSLKADRTAVLVLSSSVSALLPDGNQPMDSRVVLSTDADAVFLCLSRYGSPSITASSRKKGRALFAFRNGLNAKVLEMNGGLFAVVLLSERFKLYLTSKNGRQRKLDFKAFELIVRNSPLFYRPTDLFATRVRLTEAQPKLRPRKRLRYSFDFTFEKV